MSDEAFVPPVHKTPPEFTASGSKWELKKKSSGHFYPSAADKMLDHDCADLDPQMPSWACYVTEYEKGGIGVGKEYNFFGKDLRLKFWGMKGDADEDGKALPLYHDLAILWADGKWEVFSFAEYKVKIIAVFGEKADAKRVREVHLKLYRTAHDTKLAEITLKR